MSIRPFRFWGGLPTAPALFAAIVALLLPGTAQPYSVLTHEAIIDTLWESSIRALLLQRFPGASADELRKAHAFAYGGCIVQDMGYYPFGSKFFSDLSHYVRTGDFVMALIHDSRDLNEYAFALGSLAHYAADNEGHPEATNKAVPMVYPKLKKKFGRTVTYGQDPLSHLRTEFAFDVVQVAHGHYSPENYHDFIGFEVSKDLLGRAFEDTYSLPIGKAFSNLDLSIATYRWSVRSVIPTMTKAAWASHSIEITKEQPGSTKRKFLYNMQRASYEKEWGATREKPGAWARFLGFLFRILPKVGPLRALAIPTLTPEVDKLFMASFNTTADRVRVLYGNQGKGVLKLASFNFDTGEPTLAGTYPLADDTYAKLTGMLAANHFATVSPELRENILAYYGTPGKPVSTRAKPEEWTKLEAELAELKAVSPAPATPQEH